MTLFGAAFPMSTVKAGQNSADANLPLQEDEVSLIHIPLAEYFHYVQPILQLLFPAAQGTREGKGANGMNGHSTHHQQPPQASWANQHPFLNVSVNPIECTVVCTKALAQKLFAPVISNVNSSCGAPWGRANISSEDFVVIQVDGEGLEAGQRVLELTTPLAMAKMSVFSNHFPWKWNPANFLSNSSVFFITTYFSDYILVPAKSRDQVIRALEECGFAFEESAEAYVNPAAHQRNTSSNSSFDLIPPSTPPPRTVHQLQARVIDLLKRHNIGPRVDKDIRLIQCAGRRDNPNNRKSDEMKLQFGLVKCLAHTPRFLSLTLTDSEPASILLESRLVSNFGSGNVLLGSKEDYLIPITLDLEPLPFEATGIVCGVAGKLVGESRRDLMGAIDMRYLSTARAGTVMVDEKDLDRTMEALQLRDNGVDIHSQPAGGQ